MVWVVREEMLKQMSPDDKRIVTENKRIMTDDRRHIDPSKLEVFLVLKYSANRWDAHKIHMIINRDKAPVAGQKRGHDSGNTSVSKLDSRL